MPNPRRSRFLPRSKFAHRARVIRPATAPERGSTRTTRSPPPPCNCTASRSPAAAMPAIRVPDGSSSTMAMGTSPPSVAPPDVRDAIRCAITATRTPVPATIITPMTIVSTFSACIPLPTDYPLFAAFFPDQSDWAAPDALATFSPPGKANTRGGPIPRGRPAIQGLPIHQTRPHNRREAGCARLGRDHDIGARLMAITELAFCYPNCSCKNSQAICVRSQAVLVRCNTSPAFPPLLQAGGKAPLFCGWFATRPAARRRWLISVDRSLSAVGPNDRQTPSTRIAHCTFGIG